MTLICSLLMTVMVLSVSSTYANVFFKGKPVHGGTTANCPVDVMRLMWGNDDKNVGDRIQGQIQISKTVDDVKTLKIIVQGIDNGGAVLDSYSLTLERNLSHGYKRYPILGVVFLKYDRNNKRQTHMNPWGQVMTVVDLHYDPELEKAWFYFDFTKRTDIKNFSVVNVVLNGIEVPYNLRLVGNRLPRTLSTMPGMKKSQQGNFSVTTEWVPPPAPTAESEFVQKSSRPQQIQNDNKKEHITLQRQENEISGGTLYTAPIDWSIAVSGASFTLVPAVHESEDFAKEMSIALAGNTTVRLGYSMRLEQVLLFNPETKSRCTIDKGTSDNWPYFYLTSTRKEANIKLTDESVRFFSEATEIRCRLSFGIPNTSSPKNFDFPFSKQQVAALKALAKQCIGEEN